VIQFFCPEPHANSRSIGTCYFRLWTLRIQLKKDYLLYIDKFKSGEVGEIR
jgi:hypothetical protein